MKEGRNIEYKRTLDINSEREKLELIKDIIAISNSGGGEIVFGKDHKTRLGIDESILNVLDSAKCTDQIKKFTGISTFDLTHEVQSLFNGKYMCRLIIPSASILIVMSRDGSWDGFDTQKDKLLFRSGDIWIRHSSKTERISNDFIRRWYDSVKSEERDKILDRIYSITKLPEGSTFQIVSASGNTIETPKDLLISACNRRKRDKSHLLNAKEILWVYQNRERTDYNHDELSLLIASSLRRNATLYWWLTLLDESERSQSIIIDELISAVEGNDRDKSDANRMVKELASIYADGKKLREILTILRKSKYKHFRESSEAWISRKDTIQTIYDRIMKSKVGKNLLHDQPIYDLEKLATEIATKLYKSLESTTTSNLGDVNRVIWYNKKGHLLEGKYF